MGTYEEFAKRRAAVFAWMQPESVAVLFSGKEATRNSDVHYPFRQESFFYYLTGASDSAAAALLIKTKEDKKFIFFTLPNDPLVEQWEGKRLGLMGAKEEYGADETFAIKELEEKLSDYLLNKQKFYALWGMFIEQDQILLAALHQVQKKSREGISGPDELISLAPKLSSLRRIKSASELESMRFAAQVSAKAHSRLMQRCSPGQYEYELEAEFLNEIVQQGCRQQAYPAIIGAGENACILHYTNNNSRIKDGDLVLVDAGAEFNHYAADITRTFPANGIFSVEQKAIYELVLAAQEAALAKVKPGVAWSEQQTAILGVLTEGLLELGLLTGSLEECLAAQSYKDFYMHKSGHWLGLDVHDVGRYKQQNNWDKLEPGMVLTVEPGIYIGRNSKVDKKWWDIGVRIEDDVVVTETAHEVLSAQVPKQVSDIEALMRS